MHPSQALPALPVALRGSPAAAYCCGPFSAQQRSLAIVSKSEIRARLADGTLSRRRLSKLLATAGLAAVTVPVVARPALAQEQARYLTWSVYQNPGFFPDYVSRHGADPDLSTLAGDAKDMATLQSGASVDVAHPCNSSVPRWHEAGLLQPIDTARLSHWPDLFESLTTVTDAQQGGQQYFVPVDWGNTSVIYRPDLVDLQEQSWTLLWDERYKGRLSMSRGAEETCAIAAIVAGAADPFAMTDEEIARVRDLLKRQKPLLRFYWNTRKSVEEALAGGHLVAATGWNSSVAALRKAGVRVEVLHPKEGILMYCCGLVLARSAARIDVAYDLLDAITAPEAGKWLIEEVGFGHCNRKAFDLVGEEALADRGLPQDPKDLLSTAILFRENSRLDDLAAMFEAVKSAP
jgi:spermidine/putrescine transport system substrate-binding protein